MNAGQNTAAAQVRDARRACRRRTRPLDGRARDADLPDDLLRLQRRRPRRLPVRAGGLRQHLHPHHQPDAGGARKRASPRSKAARRRSPSPRATPRSSSSSTRCLEPGDEFVAGRQLYGGSVNQFNHSFKKFDWNVAWADATDPAMLRQGGHAQDARHLLRVDRQPRRRHRRPAGDRGHRQEGRRAASSSTTRWRRPTCAAPRSTAPTSSCTR